MMKKAIITLIILSLLAAVLTTVFAQQEKKIPFDTNVRIGKLSNGLTYYIRHNGLPSQRAEFYIVQKVGSILEEENQRGLAHFLEHMCFNGTKHFPGNTLVEELEKKGIKFGENLNASTGFDETIYNLSSIPVNREGLIDTALLVLHDWSGFVSLEDKDIDDERGVISEEWRTRNNGNFRIMEKTLKNIFPGSRYGDRMPIGLIDVIKTFNYQELRDYYHKWYRPDLQAIIVVGDIDVDQIESKIKTLFADIPMPENPAERKGFEVPDNNDPIVSIVTDPEVQGTGISVFFKSEALPDSMKDSISYYIRIVKESIISTMFNQRLYEISQQPDPPFTWANCGIGKFSVAKSKRAWSVSVNPRDSSCSENALQVILKENERMRKFGFTKSELERVQTNLLRRLESSYKEREKRQNNTYVNECIKHFLSNEPSPGIEWEYNYIKEMFSDLNLDEINQLASSFVSDTNIVFAITGPQKDSAILPSREKILSLWNETRQTVVEPNVKEWVKRPLLEQTPVSGKIIKTEDKSFGYTQWTLSNGVKVLFKKTTYKEDQVIVSAYSYGGFSLIDDVDLPSAMAINDVVPLGGIGQFSRVDLDKALTGKMVKISPFVGSISEGMNGMASPKDFETLMQLTYLTFTQPRVDNDLFNSWKSRVRTELENVRLNPMHDLRDTLNKIMTQNNKRGKLFNIDMLNKVDYKKAIELYKARFADASDFTFFITGNFDADSIKGFVETYLGGLPSSGRVENFKDQGIYPQKGIIKNHFNKKQTTRKSTVCVVYTGEIQASLQNVILMDYLRSILNIVYNESIREKEGGSYGVSVDGRISKLPKERFNLQIQFDTDPAKRDKLVGIVYDEINNIVSQLPSIENLNKVKEFLLKSHQEQLIENEYWSFIISSQVTAGIDFHTGYEKAVSAVTPAMIQEFAKKLFLQGNVIEVIMNPEE
jgi:zinc protease